MMIQSRIRNFTAAALLTAGTVVAQPAAPPAPPAPPAAVDGLQMMLDMRGGSFLGIGVREVDADRVKELKLKEERGVEVTAVDADSPASKAGLQKGDVVLEYNGQRVEGTSQFIRMVRETPAGRAVKLSVSRNGSAQTMMATVAERPAGQWRSANGDKMIVLPRMTMPDVPRALMSLRSPSLGIEAESLEGPLAQYFGVKAGVLVRRVAEGSAAEKAGLKAGDVIVKVGDESVDSPQDVTAALRNRGEKKTMALTVVRERKETAVSVTVEDAPVRRAAPSRSVRAQEFRF